MKNEKKAWVLSLSAAPIGALYLRPAQRLLLAAAHSFTRFTRGLHVHGLAGCFIGGSARIFRPASGHLHNVDVER